MSTKASILTRPKVFGLIAAFCCLLWGSAAPIIKIGYASFGIEAANPWDMVLFAGLRFTIAGLMVIAFISIKNKRLVVPSRRGLCNAFLLALTLTYSQYIFNFIGVGHASGVNASILNGTGSLMAIILACSLFRQERFTARKVIGCILGAAGILMMNAGDSIAPFTLLGEGFLLIGGFCSAIGSCQSKIYSRTDDPVMLTGWQFFLGGLMQIATALILGGRMTGGSAAGCLSLVYLGFVSAAAYSIWNLLIKHNSVSAISVYGFLIPVFGVIISAVLLGEYAQALNFNTISALVLVCLGVITVNLDTAKKTQGEK